MDTGAVELLTAWLEFAKEVCYLNFNLFLCAYVAISLKLNKRL